MLRAFADVVELCIAGQSYALVRAEPRAWGSTESLNPDDLSPALKGLIRTRRMEGTSLPKIAVLREPFCGATSEATPVGSIFNGVEGSVLEIDPSLVTGAKTQLVDVYDEAGSRISSHEGADLEEFLRSLGFALTYTGQVESSHVQSTNEVLMVSPTAFEFNSSAAEDNHFMTVVKENEKHQARATVLDEFAGLHRMLAHDVGLKVHLFEHSESHNTPDACFPNNWFSTHSGAEVASSGGRGSRGGGGTLVTYPLKAKNRRLERRPDILSSLKTTKTHDIWGSRLAYDTVLSMEAYEASHQYLEGTGCLVLDRANRVAYAALSERCHLDLARAWAREMGYERVIGFHSVDANNQPVYHTNVLMAIGTTVAVVCADSVHNESERRALLDSLGHTHEVVTITHDQMNAFCGNVLEVVDRRGLPAMVMSTQAYRAFTLSQREVLRAHLKGGLHHAPIDTLEKIGGGGVRCTIAEIFT